MIELRTLGRLDLRDSDGCELRSILTSSKRIALLTYLAVATPRGFHRKDTLLALFWPALDQEHARLALRQTLYRIRHSLTDGTLVNRGEEEIGLDTNRLWCDAKAFEALLDEGRGRVNEALDVYRGDLLEGFHLSGCLEFDRWLDGERSRLRERASGAAWSLAGDAEEAGNAVEAAHWGRRAAGFTPDDEGALRRLLALLDRLGDRTGALQEYAGFAERLRQDYDAEPAPETEELIETVRARVETNGSMVQHAPAAELVDEAERARGDERPATRRRRWTVGIAAGASLVTLAAVVLAFYLPGGSKLAEQRVIVAAFENRTGDASLDPVGYMAADWIAQGLLGTGLVEVVSPAEMLRSAQALQKETGMTPGLDMALTLAEVTEARLLVSGSYYPSNDGIAFHAQVTDVATGRLLRGVAGVSGATQDVGVTVAVLRERVMGSLATVVDERLASWSGLASQPPSYQAYQLYAAGLDLFLRGDRLQAGDLLRGAWELDTTFTAPLVWAVYAYWGSGRPLSADTTLDYLKAVRDRLPPWDRAMANHILAQDTMDWEGALEAARRVASYGPDSEWLYKLGLVAIWANHPREAVAALSRIDTEKGWMKGWRPYWPVLANAWHLLGEYERELETVRRGQARFGREAYWKSEAQALAVLGRADEAIEVVESALLSGQPVGIMIGPLNVLISRFRRHGNDEAAATLIRRALEWYEGRSPVEKERVRYQHARLVMRAGRLSEARGLFESLAKEAAAQEDRLREIYCIGYLGTIALREGDRERATEILRWMEEAPLPPGRKRGLRQLTAHRLNWRARLAAESGDRETAMRLLRQALEHGLKYYYPHYRGFESLRDYPPFQELLRPKG